MLAPTMLLTMFQYNYDTNNRLINKAAEVTPQQWDERQPADQRSLHETLFHILAVEEEWLSFCQSEQAPAWDWRPFADYPDVPSLRALNDQIFATYSPYVAALTEDQLMTRRSGVFPSRREESVLVWHILIHMHYHSAQHRAEVASILTRYDKSPWFIDFYGFGNWGEG
jgi:uncharacterized damage-inducible protein DinB